MLSDWTQTEGALVQLVVVTLVRCRSKLLNKRRFALQFRLLVASPVVIASAWQAQVNIKSQLPAPSADVEPSGLKPKTLDPRALFLPRYIMPS